MYGAYETLSAPLRHMIENLEALHDGIPNFTAYLLDPGTPDGRHRLQRMKETAEVSVHPMLRTHPETGRRSIYINRAFTTRIMGLSEIESRHLLELLFDHMEQSSFQMRYV